MKKLLVFMLVFCGCAAVLSAKNTPKSEALAKKINAEAVKQQQQAGMRNIMRVRLESGVNGGSWLVSCSALLDHNASLTLDTPCTEALAVSYTNGFPVYMTVDLSKLGAYSSGSLKGQAFEYTGVPDPKSFRVQENGLAVFQLPVRTPEVKNAIAKLPSLAGMSDANKGYFFRKSERPSSFNSGAPGYDERRNYPASSVAGFQKFLTVLDKDLKYYASVLGGPVAMRNYIDADKYEDVNGYAVFINRQGDAVITSYKSYEYYDGLLAEFGGKGDFYLNLAGMGKYANGKGFFFNGTATALDNRAQNDVADRPTRVRFDLPKNGPVYNELQNTKKFYNHKIVTLWLQDFAPRIHRIAALMSK